MSALSIIQTPKFNIAGITILLLTSFSPITDQTYKYKFSHKLDGEMALCLNRFICGKYTYNLTYYVDPQIGYTFILNLLAKRKGKPTRNVCLQLYSYSKMDGLFLFILV